jgi:SAM-dependent methyltransferase
MVTRQIFSQLTEPSKTLLSVASELSKLQGWPVLDAGCGVGRNAAALALNGMSVVCVDRDIDRLRDLSAVVPQYIVGIKPTPPAIGTLYPICANLDPSSWPFLPCQFSAITCVHFFKIELLDSFWSSLVTGGCLFVETFGGHGQNYLDLPKRGQVLNLLSERFDIAFYRERKVGPIDHDAVSVKLLAKKK